MSIIHPPGLGWSTREIFVKGDRPPSSPSVSISFLFSLSRPVRPKLRRPLSARSGPLVGDPYSSLEDGCRSFLYVWSVDVDLSRLLDLLELSPKKGTSEVYSLVGRTDC